MQVEKARREISGFELSKFVPWLVFLPQTERCVLRILVDHFPNVWPSLNLISHLTGRGTTRVRLALRSLEQDKLILAKGNKKGGNPLRVTQYEIAVDLIRKLAMDQQMAWAARGKPNGRQWAGVAVEATPTDGPTATPPRTSTATPTDGCCQIEKEEQTRNEEIRNEEIRQKRKEEALVLYEDLVMSRQTRQEVQSAPGNPVRSPIECQKLTEVILTRVRNVASGAIIYGKERKDLQRQIQESDWTERELVAATTEILYPLDEWALKRAGDTLCAQIGPEIQNIRAEEKKAKESEERYERIKASIVPVESGPEEDTYDPLFDPEVTDEEKQKILYG